MLNQNDLVLTGASLGTDNFEVILEAASAGGFAGLSLRLDTYFEAKDRGLSIETMREMLADKNLVVNDLDAIVFSMKGGDGAPWQARCNEELVLETAQALEVKQANTVFIGNGEATTQSELEYFAETFAVVAQKMLAADICPYIEFVPSVSPIKNVNDVSKILQYAGIDQAGYLLDSWHCHVGSTTEQDLLALPGERILAVQLSDIPAKPPEELIKVGLHERVAPGLGGLDLIGFIRRLDKLGSTAPLAVEVFSDQLLQEYEPIALACYFGDSMRELIRVARQI